MNLPPLDPRRAEALLARLDPVQVVVIGDVMLDRFVGRVTRISPEAPVPVVRFQSEHVRLGGAANVAHNLAALGAKVSLIGIVGLDPAADRLKELLEASHIDASGLVEDSTRPTVEKVRIVTSRNQQVARIDYEEDAEAGHGIEAQLVDRLVRAAPESDVFLVSDYLKGAVTRALMYSIAGQRKGAALLVDPKIPHLDYYAGATLITPNHFEAEIATHRRIRTDEEARQAAADFRVRARCEAALITRGEQGMWLSSADAEGSIPSVAREVSDVTGAGDTVIATLALALAAGATLGEAAALANYAAGVAVGKFGAATVTRAELLAAVRGGIDPLPRRG